VVDPLRARYLIAHKLASGGFGDVYAGVRKKDGMPVALKVVPKKRMREINTVIKFSTKKRIFFKNQLFDCSRTANYHLKLLYYVA
jgi:serine/threonine protein kinase